jgi:hypothetical protein
MSSYVRSYKVDIKLGAIPKKGIAKLLVYIIAILIYYIVIAKDKDLLFKLNNTLITLFV